MSNGEVEENSPAGTDFRSQGPVVTAATVWPGVAQECDAFAEPRGDRLGEQFPWEAFSPCPLRRNVTYGCFGRSFSRVIGA